MRVLVTGCCGFIGSHLAAYLRCGGYDVYGLDNLSRATREPVKALEESEVGYRVADIANPAQVVDVVRLSKPDVLVHLAALVDIEESVRRPSLYTYVNVYGTSVVVEKALEYGVERVVYISSAAMYGEPRRLLVSEEHPTNPTNPYGVTKLASEHLVKTICRLARKTLCCAMLVQCLWS